MKKFIMSLLIGCAFFQSTLLCASNLSQILYDKVLETIENSQNIPGLKSEEFPHLRPELSEMWSALIENQALEVRATDKDTRPYFVALQGIIEHVLSSELQNSVYALTGVIHTPMPTTPLCTKGEISEQLVDPSIEADPLRLFTVKARTTILRDYLFKGGNLYVVYPKGGLAKRSQEQQGVYSREVAASGHLFDTPIDCEALPADLIGATYLFRDAEGSVFAFSIKMTQAKDPKDMGDFGLWFGSVDQPAVQRRVRDISQFLESMGVSPF